MTIAAVSHRTASLLSQIVQILAVGQVLHAAEYILSIVYIYRFKRRRSQGETSFLIDIVMTDYDELADKLTSLNLNEDQRALFLRMYTIFTKRLNTRTRLIARYSYS